MSLAVNGVTEGKTLEQPGKLQRTMAFANSIARSKWYYEQPRPEGRRKYSKTAPLIFEEFAPCLAWWKDREANERAWQIDAGELVRRDDAGRVTACNLDVKNPHSEVAEDHRSPAEIVDAIIAKERRVLVIMSEIKATLAETV